jgi:hypothetical protein
MDFLIKVSRWRLLSLDCIWLLIAPINSFFKRIGIQAVLKSINYFVVLMEKIGYRLSIQKIRRPINLVLIEEELQNVITKRQYFSLMASSYQYTLIYFRNTLLYQQSSSQTHYHHTKHCKLTTICNPQKPILPLR